MSAGLRHMAAGTSLGGIKDIRVKKVFILLTFKHCITSVRKKFCGSILNKQVLKVNVLTNLICSDKIREDCGGTSLFHQ